MVISAMRDSGANYIDIQVSPYKQTNRAVIYVKSSVTANAGTAHLEGLAVGRWK